MSIVRFGSICVASSMVTRAGQDQALSDARVDNRASGRFSGMVRGQADPFDKALDLDLRTSLRLPPQRSSDAVPLGETGQ